MRRPEFRRPREGELPTAGGIDELLDDPPEGVPSSLEGYRQGTRVRRWVWGSLIVGVLTAGFAGKLYVDHLREQRRVPEAEYELVGPAEGRSRVMQWTSGQARLGLSRDPPGVEAIVLPDRVLRLAEGHDHAQVKLEVRDGETVSLDVIVGRIVQEPRDTPESSRAPEATPP